MFFSLNFSAVFFYPVFILCNIGDEKNKGLRAVYRSWVVIDHSSSMLDRLLGAAMLIKFLVLYGQLQGN